MKWVKLDANLSREASAEVPFFSTLLAIDWTSDSVLREWVIGIFIPRVSACFAACKTPDAGERSTENWNSMASPEVSLCCEARHDKNVPRSLESGGVGRAGGREKPGGNVSITTSDVGSITSARNRARANFRAETFWRRGGRGGKGADFPEQYRMTARSPRYLTKSNKRATFPELLFTQCGGRE